MAVIHDVRAHALDDLTNMLLRLARKIEWKSEQRLAEWYQTRRSKTDTLIRAFHDSLIVHGTESDPLQKVSRVETLFAAQGGRDALAQSCEEHLRHERQNWRPFARAVFVPLRHSLLRLVELLEWIMDDTLRRTVHKGTTKIERHHKFSKHLAFGAGGHLRSNNPADEGQKERGQLLWPQLFT